MVSKLASCYRSCVSGFVLPYILDVMLIAEDKFKFLCLEEHILWAISHFTQLKLCTGVGRRDFGAGERQGTKSSTQGAHAEKGIGW